MAPAAAALVAGFANPNRRRRPAWRRQRGCEARDEPRRPARHRRARAGRETRGREHDRARGAVRGARAGPGWLLKLRLHTLQTNYARDRAGIGRRSRRSRSRRPTPPGRLAHIARHAHGTTAGHTLAVARGSPPHALGAAGSRRSARQDGGAAGAAAAGGPRPAAQKTRRRTRATTRRARRRGALLALRGRNSLSAQKWPRAAASIGPASILPPQKRCAALVSIARAGKAWRPADGLDSRCSFVF